MWAPESCPADLLATTGDYLRLWDTSEDGSTTCKCMLNNVRSTSGDSCRAACCPSLRRRWPIAAGLLLLLLLLMLSRGAD
jgi:hypothetical protein